jgi:aerobic-type carbon monoxide dehydrogenase small subunit (CoxS/CutS family)
MENHRAVPVKLRINGLERELVLAPERILLDVIREDLNLTGTKRGCDLGTCGCCTVLIDGEPRLSCLLLAKLVEGRDITTIEGVTPAQGLNPVQEAFVERGATQCGFCTPGFVLTALGLLRKNPQPRREEIQQAISGNLCRCTGYVKIVEAIELAARRWPSPREVGHGGSG